MGTSKRKPSPQQPAGEYRPLQVCFERILPDELDTGRGARLAVRELLLKQAARSGREIGKPKQHFFARMAVRLSKKWPPRHVVRCMFLDGSPTMRAKVEKYAHQWERHANVKFRFTDDADAEIRISFYADEGSWSAVGTDALNKDYFRPGAATMNYGWLRDDSAEAEYRRVVLHEFGHALGCIHEHEAATFTRKWNREEVYRVFGGPPNNWSRADIDANVLHKYAARGISATEFDPASIMLYAFDAKLFTDGLGPTNENSRLSAKDVKKIVEMYPK